MAVANTDGNGNFTMYLPSGSYTLRSPYPPDRSVPCLTQQPLKVGTASITGVKVVCDLD